MRKSRSLNRSLQERDELLEIYLEQLIQKSRDGAVTVVEGLRDAEALRGIGVTGTIICAKSGCESVSDSMERLANVKSELILLTDFDRSGRELLWRMARKLEQMGKIPNLHFWLKFNGLISNCAKDIEGMISYLQNGRRVIGGIQIESNSTIGL
ncbi:MAG: toprim domain-containing protein [Candidatus Bathyarchaeia archaeon]